MKEILFATGNQRKIKEAQHTLSIYGISVQQTQVDCEEIQHADPAEITKAKARAAFAATQQPTVVSDTSWEVPALGGFPGGYMKDVAAWFAAEDWLSIMARHDDKTIYCHEHVAYYDGTELRHFAASYPGRFISEVRGTAPPHESFCSVVVMHDNRTIAEQLEASGNASEGLSLEDWKQFGEWFARRE